MWGAGGEVGASIVPDFEIEQVDGVPRSSELPEQTPRNQAILTIPLTSSTGSHQIEFYRI